jgi:hypothetical protein
MACKKINTDSLSAKLKAITPSSIGSLSPKIKISNIGDAFSAAAGDIKGKVTAAVENFKNLKTGATVDLKLPKFDPASFYEKIDDTVEGALNAFTDVKDKLLLEKNKASDFIKSQLDCVNSDATSKDELAAAQGELFTGIKGDVKAISNNQLRDFNEDPSNQSSLVDDITNNAIEEGKKAAEKGITNEAKATHQQSTLNKLDNLVV